MISRNNRCLLLVLLALVARQGEALPNPYQRFLKGSGAPLSSSDSGEPLFLTPFIKIDRLEEGRKQSKVVFPDYSGVESYSGFITVDEKYQSNLFFWYVAAETNAAKAPVVVWLQGGPGASSLVGLFEEHGPFHPVSRGGNQVGVERREYSWHKNHHMIYIDSPVGSGFSFTKNDAGYATSEVDVGRNLYKFIQQFFKLFPQLQRHPLYISGESYGGKYVPAFAGAIHNASDANINLQGLAIGNGYTDPLNQLNYGEYLHQHGFIDWHAKLYFDKEVARAIQYANNNQRVYANRIMDALLDGVDGRASYLKNVSGLASYYNYLQVEEGDVDDNAMMQYLQKPDVRKAIHVGNLPFQNTDNAGKVADKLANDMLDTVAPWVEHLLEYYPVLFYNGQLDVICAYPMAENFLRKLSFPWAGEYKRAARQIYRVDGEVAGYLKTAGNLREMMIRAAGHMVPKDQPKWAFDVISSFTHNKL